MLRQFCAFSFFTLLELNLRSRASRHAAMFDPSGPNTRQAKHQGAKRLERWLTSLPGAVALRAAHDAPGLSLSAMQIVCTKPDCAPIETLVTLAGGANGDASVQIPKPIAEASARGRRACDCFVCRGLALRGHR